MRKLTIKLAKEILFVVNNPVPKVRLAKLIYFIFKELVRNDYYKINDLAFIRMPLGPVPVDFNDEVMNDADIMVKKTDIGLTYNRENFSIKQNYETDVEYLPLLKKKIRLINRYPTSYLIERSHQDNSWRSHVNGDTYYITQEDLVVFKKTPTKTLLPQIDDQLVQSKLVKGMKEEIVKDSSSLEYPDHYSSDK